MSKGLTNQEIDRLVDLRIETQAKVRSIRDEVEREFAPKIAEEIAYRTRAIERMFATELVEAKENGATYEQRVKIVGTGKAEVMRHYMELGGGSTRRAATGIERSEMRIADSGLTHRGGLDFDWLVNGTQVACQIVWRGDKPELYPVGTDNLLFFRDEAKITREDRMAKGAEAVELFGLTKEED